MVSSSSMAVQDKCGGVRSSTVQSASNGVPLTAGLHDVNGLQYNERSPPVGNDFAFKVRKPYTITKQREKWTDEEHKKFIEALKLYGRAWRRIEEHVGTKTAVQIRSHAQKFFSKVSRESNGSSEEPIVIPPPRPKRKPMHPYPRKLGNLTVKESPGPDQIRRSPNLSLSERENQSPTSVLSAGSSDALGSSDSNSPNGGLSPISSAVRCDLTLCEPYDLPEDCRSPSAIPIMINSLTHGQQPLKLELFPRDSISTQEQLDKETKKPSLKLFGRIVLVTESHTQSSPTSLTSKSSPEMNEGKPIQPLPRKLILTEKLSRTSETVYSLIPLLSIPFHESEPTNGGSDSNNGDIQEKECLKEGSSTGSNTGSADDTGVVDKNSDVETLSPENKEEKEVKRTFGFRWSDRSAFSQLVRATSDKQAKGFVPYKKRRLVEVDAQSSVTGGVEQEIRLCL